MFPLCPFCDINTCLWRSTLTHKDPFSLCVSRWQQRERERLGRQVQRLASAHFSDTFCLIDWPAVASDFIVYKKLDNFACIMFLSSHPEVVKVTVHPATSPELSNAGAAAHRVAGERTLWVLCGCFSEKETHQELLLPRGHLPIPQGKSRNWVLLLVTSDNFYVGRSKNAESANCFETKQTSKVIEKKNQVYRVSDHKIP